jgi:hypothetical protein
MGCETGKRLRRFPMKYRFTTRLKRLIGLIPIFALAFCMLVRCLAVAPLIFMHAQAEKTEQQLYAEGRRFIDRHADGSTDLGQRVDECLRQARYHRRMKLMYLISVIRIWRPIPAPEAPPPELPPPPVPEGIPRSVEEPTERESEPTNRLHLRPNPESPSGLHDRGRATS